jgi:hypothetical protein
VPDIATAPRKQAVNRESQRGTKLDVEV